MADTHTDPFALRDALGRALRAARLLVAAEDEELDPLFAAGRLPGRVEAVLAFGRVAAEMGLAKYAEERARECDPPGSRDSDLDRRALRHATAHAAAGREPEARAELARRPGAGMTADTVQAFFDEHRRRRAEHYQDRLAAALADAGVAAHEFANYYLSGPAGLTEREAGLIGTWLRPLCRQPADVAPDNATAPPAPAPAQTGPPGDGPCEPWGFRLGGRTLDFADATLRRALLVALWDGEGRRPHPARLADEVMDAVYPGEDEADDKLKDLCKQVRRVMRRAAVPYTVRLVQGKVWLEPTA